MKIHKHMSFRSHNLSETVTRGHIPDINPASLTDHLFQGNRLQRLDRHSGGRN